MLLRDKDGMIKTSLGKGYIQVYTGNGKGKTTASLGLVLRSLGAGLKVHVVQFLKKGDYSEIKALKKFGEQVTVEQYGLGKLIRANLSEADEAAGKRGLARVREIISNRLCDVLVVEEGNVAVMSGLFTLEELLDTIEGKPEGMEIIITGRGAAQKLIDRADLVTEMQEIKHYYQNGVEARVGIEK